MNNNLDEALKTYFAPRDEIPNEVRAQLSVKLINAELQEEKIPPIWISVPFAFLASVMILIATGVVFGNIPALLLGFVYYSVTAVTVASVLMLILAMQNKNIVQRRI